MGLDSNPAPALQYVSRSGTAESYGKLYLYFYKGLQTDFQSYLPFYIPTRNWQEARAGWQSGSEASAVC